MTHKSWNAIKPNDLNHKSTWHHAILSKWLILNRNNSLKPYMAQLAGAVEYNYISTEG